MPLVKQKLKIFRTFLEVNPFDESYISCSTINLKGDEDFTNPYNNAAVLYIVEKENT